MEYVAEGYFPFLDAIKSIDVIDDYTIRCNLSEFKNIMLGGNCGVAGMISLE